MDHAWSILEETYGDPLTHLNKVTFKASGKTLGIESEYEDEIEVSVDDAGPILEEAFGDPATHFNLRLRVMKAIQPLSDKTVETNPNKATKLAPTV